MTAPVQSALAAVAATLLPPERKPLAVWAGDHFRLSSEASAQVGAFTPFPFQVEPLNALSPRSGYETVVLQWGAQLGKSSILLAFISNIIAEDPGPILVVQPTLAMCEAFSKDRIAPMVRDVPALRGKVAEAKSRDAGSTVLHRRFVGGHLTLVGANSPSGLASRPIRYMLADEVDRYEASAGSEGDPVALAIARTRTFWNRKIVLTSTPTVKGSSRIEAAYLESDRREYFVPCPLCRGMQVLTWRRVEWPRESPSEAAYRCEHCEQLIPHHRKSWMVANGTWRAANPSSRIAGFRLSELYSPFRSWGDLVDDFLKAQGNPERLRAFINTSLCELWDPEGQSGVTEAELLSRRESYGPTLPPQVALITAGADLQGDRLEVSVYGWGAGEESWLLAHRIIPGDPQRPELWAALDQFLSERWQQPLIGPMPVHACCIDSGYLPEQVTRFADARRGRRIWATKGAPGARPIWPKKASRAPKGTMFLLGTDAARSVVAGRLKIAEGPGRIHLPTTVGEGFVEQLCSEYQLTTYKRGRPERSWVRKAGRRAEAWDCAVYALAALSGLRAHGVNLDMEAARITEAARSQPAPTVYQSYRSKFLS